MADDSRIRTLVTVLRTGGDFLQEHAVALKAQLELHSPDVRFLCLTDLSSVQCSEPLEHNWPGWWSKMEAYRLPGPTLLADLDTVILGSLESLFDAIEADDRPIFLRDFNPKQRLLGTGLVGWSGSMRHVYDKFSKYPRYHMEKNRSPRFWGDQGFMESWVLDQAIVDDKASNVIRYWQDEVPGAVVSFKKHCVEGVAPKGAKVVCYHGKPRPWELGAGCRIA